MKEKKKKRFLPILAAVVALIVIYYLVWINVPHRLIPEGAGSFVLHSVGYSDGIEPELTGNVILGKSGYYLSEEGQDELFELLRTCRMRIHLGTSWDYIEGNENLSFGGQYKVNGRTGGISVNTMGGSLHVSFSSRSLGFPGSIFLSDTNYMARISNYSCEEFIALVRDICGRYGTEH